MKRVDKLLSQVKETAQKNIKQFAFINFLSREIHISFVLGVFATVDKIILDCLIRMHVFTRISLDFTLNYSQFLSSEDEHFFSQEKNFQKKKKNCLRFHTRKFKKTSLISLSENFHEPGEILCSPFLSCAVLCGVQQNRSAMIDYTISRGGHISPDINRDKNLFLIFSINFGETG